MRNIFEEILNDKDITVERCRELARGGIAILDCLQQGLKEIEKKSKHDRMLIEAYQENGEFDNRFKFAEEILGISNKSGLTISDMVNRFSDGDDFFNGVWDIPYLSDRQCRILSQRTGFTYRYIRSEFSSKDFSFSTQPGE